MPPAAEHPELWSTCPVSLALRFCGWMGSGPTSGPFALLRQYGSVCSPLPKAREQVYQSGWGRSGSTSVAGRAQHRAGTINPDRSPPRGHSLPGARPGRHSATCVQPTPVTVAGRDNRAVQLARNEGSTATTPPPASLHLGRKALVRLGRLCQRYWRSRSASRSIRSKGCRHDPCKEERYG